MRPKSTTGGSKDLSDHFAFDRGSYTKALLSGNFSALLQNCRIARRPQSASGCQFNGSIQRYLNQWGGDYNKINKILKIDD